MAFYVVSERNSNHGIAWGTSYEFEDIIASTCNGEIVAPYGVSFHPVLDKVMIRYSGPHYHEVKNFKFSDEPNMILLVGMGPRTMRMLNCLGRWRRKKDTVAAYIIDLYPGSLKRLDAGMVNKLDHLFVSYEQMLDPVHERFSTPVTFIAQACDVLKQGACCGDRPIDIIGLGRQRKDVHKAIQQAFNRPGSGRIYFHSTFRSNEVKNWREERDLFWMLMRHAKMSMAYCFVETHPQVAFGVSPLTARWFEAITAGCAIVGRKPVGPEADRFLNWDDAVIDLPKKAKHCLAFIEELLDDTTYLAGISRRNYLEALRRHDWRYRLKDMFEAMDIAAPRALVSQLKDLRRQVEALESSTNPNGQKLFCAEKENNIV